MLHLFEPTWQVYKQGDPEIRQPASQNMPGRGGQGQGAGSAHNAAPSSPKQEAAVILQPRGASRRYLCNASFRNADLRDGGNPRETHSQYGPSSETQTAESQEAAGFLIKTNR